MLTREELLAGVVTINNERVDSKAPAKTQRHEVRGVGSDGSDQRTGEPGAHAAPAKGDVPGAEESLHEFIERRKRTVLGKLTEVADRIVITETELAGLQKEKMVWKDELNDLDMLGRQLSSSPARKAGRSETSSDTGASTPTPATSSPGGESSRSTTSKGKSKSTSTGRSGTS